MVLAGAPRPRGSGGRLTAALVLALCALPAVSGTCATFAAWMRADTVVPGGITCAGACTEMHGFVVVHVAPDAKSVVVSMQLTVEAGAVPRDITGAGIFGPASEDEIKPMGAVALLDLGVPTFTAGKTWTGSVRLESARMHEILAFMREGRTYASVMTAANPNGELRGQLRAPMCLETRVTGLTRMGDDGQPVMPYAFANMLVSATEDSYALLLQMATDESRLFPGRVTDASVRDAAGTALVTLSLSPTDFFYTMPNADNPMVMDTFNLPQGEANRADQQERVYRVGHMVGGVAMEALGAIGVSIEVESDVDLPMSYHIMGNFSHAVPCRTLITPHDSLFSLARAHGSDWLTVWSLNEGNPDVRLTLEPRYFAHPFEVASGDTGAGVMSRFGMSEMLLYRNNPALKDPNALDLGAVLCVVPNWLETAGGNGQKICSATAA